jgi:Yip1 domain
MGTTPAPAPNSSVSAVPPGEGLSESSRVINTFIAPSKTFTDINRNSSWWVPFVIMSIVSILFVFAIDQKISFQRVADNQLKANPKQMDQFEKLPPDQQAAQMNIRLKATKWISYGFPVFILLVLVISAAVLMGTFNFGAGAQISFGRSLAVVMYAHLPGILKSILAAVAVFAGMDPEGFQIDNPIATNPGFFFSPTDHPALYKLASSIDLFTIWTLVLLVIGFTCISKVKKGTSAAIVFGWYAVVVLVGVAFAAM